MRRPSQLPIIVIFAALLNGAVGFALFWNQRLYLDAWCIGVLLAVLIVMAFDVLWWSKQ